MKHPLVNVFLHTNVWVWHRFCFDGLSDLYPIAIGDVPEVGAEPDWWSMTSFDEISGIYKYTQANRLGKHNYSYTWLQFAMEQGIAPGQAFLLSVDTPQGYRSYEGEYDEDWSWEIVERAPLPRAVAAKRWAQVWRQRTLRQYMEMRACQEAEALALRDVSSMYITKTHYQTSRDTYSPSPPRGIRLTLHTSRREFGAHLNQIAPACDAAGNVHRAMDQLIKNATEVSPYLSPEIIEGLPVKTW